MTDCRSPAHCPSRRRSLQRGEGVMINGVVNNNVVWRRAAICAVALALLAGCGRTEVQFVLNREGQKPRKELAADQRELRPVQDAAIVDILYTMFGTPDQPAAWGGTAVSGLDERKLRLAAG